MREFGIGLLGFGTVGAGVVEGLQRNGELLTARLGARQTLRGVADLDVARDRGVKLDPSLLTTNAAAVVDSPDVDIVVELIGGTGVAAQLMRRALARGKPVITANKALLAEHGAELFALAAANNTDIYFGASVGGGIPIIRVLREGLAANRIRSIHGILNGTCNYILTRMEQEGLAFDAALREAQASGFAEADPTLDIDGYDTAHKAAILAMLAYGIQVPKGRLTVEGIRGLAPEEIRYGADLGYRVKLLAVIEREGDAVGVRVHPAMVPHGHMLASVGGVFNAVMVNGDMTGPTLYYGRGAGRAPTASTVIGDIGDVIRNLLAGGARHGHVGTAADGNVRLMEDGDAQTRSYLRLSLRDRPGTLARITAALGDHGVSIASVMQKEESADDYVPVVIVTHQARDRACRDALDEIAGLDVVRGAPVRVRIEE
jgi:homoserine dehydrogenase